MDDFSGIRCLVTGGASGIGAATTDMLIARGASVTVIDRERPVDPRADVEYVGCDIRDRAAVMVAVSAAGEAMDGIDIVVNNAGIGADGDVADADDEEWHRVLDVNVVGTARVSAAALPFLRRSSHAAIVNVSSVVAPVGVPRRAVYAASKGAVLSLTLAMAADHLSDGIRVNAVLPGTADTPWVERLLATSTDPDAAGDALRARQPMGRLVTAAEVAFAICYLASPLAGSTTGTLLGVDGGMATLRVPAVR